MQQAQLDRTRQHYTTLSDEELTAAYAAGVESYQDSEVWQLIEAEYRERGLAAHPLPPTQTTSPWFFLSRLNNARPWEASQPLPLNYLHFQGAIMALVTLAVFLNAFYG